MAGGKRGLSEREKSFCYYYTKTMNEARAAEMAGIVREGEDAGLCGMRLILEERIRNEIRRLFKITAEVLDTAAVVKRLAETALGAADGTAIARLMRDDEAGAFDVRLDPDQLEEIKRGKGGVFEVKPVDRAAALLKCIGAIEGLKTADGGDTGFYAAIAEAARELGCEASDSGDER